MTKQRKGKKEHKHDWQLLSYGNRAGYVGTLTDMVVLMVCRDCGKVVEQPVEKIYTNVTKIGEEILL
jgi:Fe2+ or Zn2+ uptake regulation protein